MVGVVGKPLSPSFLSSSNTFSGPPVVKLGEGKKDWGEGEEGRKGIQIKVSSIEFSPGGGREEGEEEGEAPAWE